MKRNIDCLAAWQMNGLIGSSIDRYVGTSIYKWNGRYVHVDRQLQVDS